MSGFIDRYEQQLRSVKPPRRRSWRPSRTAAIGLISISLSGTALAASELWNPTVGDERRGHPTTTTDAPPAGELEAVAALRRQPTAADRGPVVQRALRFFGPDVAGVKVNEARLLRNGRFDAALVPVDRFNVGLADTLGVPERRDGLCLFFADPQGDGGGQACLTGAQLRAGASSNALGHVVYGLVPDGVASVELLLDGGNTVTAPVEDNLYALEISPDQDKRPSNAPRDVAPAATEVRWLGADGEPIATYVNHP